MINLKNMTKAVRAAANRQWTGRQSDTTGSPVVAGSGMRAPLWTPRDYARLATEGYQNNVIVYRAVSLIARSIASVPWLLYDRDQELAQHPLLHLLRQPCPQQTGNRWIETVISHLLLAGNAYIEMLVDHTGQPRELHCLRPDRLSIEPGSGGVPSAYIYTVEGRVRRIQHDTEHPPILHLRTFHPLNDWYGMSPLDAAARAVDQHNTVSGHNLALLQNGGRPSGALALKPGSTPMTDEQRRLLRQDIAEGYGGAVNAGRVMILEGDFEWREMGLSPKDLDFIEGKYLSAREIAQAFGVPPMLVGVPGDATFANYREARFHLWEDTVLPLLDHITAELNRWLVQRYFDSGLMLSYDVDAIPALAPRREATWAKIAAADFLTDDEKRQALGYAPNTTRA